MTTEGKEIELVVGNDPAGAATKSMKDCDEQKVINASKSLYGRIPSDDAMTKNYAPWFLRRVRNKTVLRFMESSQMQGFLGVLLMISLFLPDSWALGNPSNDADAALYSILVAVFFFFTLEVVVLSVVQDGYFDRRNFFFWMDVLGTLSIILDIGWISDMFMPQGATTSGSLLRAARAAKLGARYGRIMRLLKLMKFFHYLPCFKRDDSEEKEPTMTAVRKVSNELSSVLSKRVAFLVLFLVIIIPFLSHETFDFSVSAWIDSMVYVVRANLVDATQCSALIDDMESFYDSKDTVILSVEVNGPSYDVTRTYESEDDVRWQNLYTHKETWSSGGTSYSITVKTDETAVAKWGAMFGILLILLVIFVLFGFSASFQGAVDVLVVVPLEKMMSALRESASLMLRSMKAWDKEDEDDEHNSELDDLDEELETAVLERMVEKLARLCRHMIPNHEMEIDADIDTSTAEWLREMNTGLQRRTSGSNASITMKDAFMSIDDISGLYEKIGIVKPKLVNSFYFDTTQYDEKELAHITRYIFDVAHVFDEFEVDRDGFELFVVEVGKKYKLNPYHNFQHCIDVTQTLYHLIMTARLNTQLSTLEIFAALLAALGHDMAHPGVNNGYLRTTKHELAIRFNDVSPLENMHCSQLFKLLGDEKFNILSALSDAQWRDVRKIVIKAILGTDMEHHFGTVKKVNIFHEVHHSTNEAYYSGEVDTMEAMKEYEQRMDVIEWFLHTADVSNPYKPFEICSKWAHFVVDEFWLQGDKEREEGMDVSAMNDRNSPGSICDIQMGFIGFMVEPLVTAMVKAFPALHPIATQLDSNFSKWAETRCEELKQNKFVKESIEADSKKTEEKAQKFSEKMAYKAQCIAICEKTAGGPGTNRKSSVDVNLRRSTSPVL